MPLYHVVIVGAGPRGLSVLERLAAIYADRRPGWGLHVHLIDPAKPGQGTHSSLQPDHLLTNTVAGQITLFTDSSVRDSGPIKPGPSFLDWARAAGYRRVNGRFVLTDTDGEEIHENDYLPRAMLGEYLTYVYELVATSLPPNLRLTHYRCMAADIRPQGDGKMCVVLAGGFPIIADGVVMTTGHSENRASEEDDRLQQQVLAGQVKNPKLQFLTSVNPINVLRSISPAAQVCVQGMGLTAYDIVSELTVGRGGRFLPAGNRRLRYEPSGREPHMILFSRQGVPFSARAVNQKGVGGLHRPVFFTKAWIDGVRRQKEEATGSGKLDYGVDLWPTLKKEVCFVYDATRSGAQPGDPAHYLPSAASEQAISEIFSPLGIECFEDERAFDDAVRRHTESDLAHAFVGNVDSPVKAATDVLRDVRDYIRYAVDYGGLTEESHSRFLNDVIPVMYRIAAGAPKERNIELLALIDAGIATFGPGPSPDLSLDQVRARFVLRSTRLSRPVEKYADVLVRARIDCSVYPEKQDSALIGAMLRGGTVRPYMNGAFHPGGIDVDASQNVISATGLVQRNLWALGILVEGANFCTYVLPRALVNSRFIQFSGRCALKMFALIAERHALESAASAASAPPSPLAADVRRADEHAAPACKIESCRASNRSTPSIDRNVLDQQAEGIS
jgi:uncharacterized NAD(P)/FAD-binding protein YdhS